MQGHLVLPRLLFLLLEKMRQHITPASVPLMGRDQRGHQGQAIDCIGDQNPTFSNSPSTALPITHQFLTAPSQLSVRGHAGSRCCKATLPHSLPPHAKALMQPGSFCALHPSPLPQGQKEPLRTDRHTNPHFCPLIPLTPKRTRCKVRSHLCRLGNCVQMETAHALLGAYTQAQPGA